MRKGETGELVVYANSVTRTKTDDKGDEIQREMPFLKGYTMFNAEQCTELPALFQAPAAPFTPRVRMMGSCRSSRPLQCRESRQHAGPH